MQYAIVQIQGHQYIIKQWDSITVDLVDQEEKSNLTVDTVLLAFDEKGEKVIVGTPYIPKSKVEFTITKNQQWDKMRVTKFKRKNRYQRTIGFRPQQSVLEVKKIEIHG